MIGVEEAPVVSNETRVSSGRRAHKLLACAFGALYLAVLCGHLSSMDGLFMARQGYALAVDHTIRFQAPLWTWRSQPIWVSHYGIGLSLLYVPGMVAGAAFRSHVPISIDRPTDLWAFYLRELYEDHLYTVGASWVHVVIVALAAYLVARLIVALGFSRSAAAWGMAFYGLGSSAVIYARGDFAQPLEGLCWTAALLAIVRFRRTTKWSDLAAAAFAVGYAILTRPVEGMLLVPAVMIFVLPKGRLSDWRLPALRPVAALVVAALAGVAITLLVNWARFGDPLQFGYDDDNGWVVPDIKRWAGVLVSPGRGIIWEFPAIALIPLGSMALFRRGKRRELLAILFLSGALLLNTSAWYMWWGGFCWGLRLFSPAVPLLAVVAGAGADQLRAKIRGMAGGTLLALGFVWALPGLMIDILGGYGELGEKVWPIAAYPPYGAWQFLQRLRPQSPEDVHTLDILWFRLAPATGNWSLLVPVVLVMTAAVLFARSRRLLSTGQN